MIIAISGKKTHGKNLLATVIQYHIYCKKMLMQHSAFQYPVERFVRQVSTIKDFSFTKEETGWELKSLAYKLKACTSIILNIPIEKFEDRDFKLTNLPSCWDRFFWRDYKGKKHKIEFDLLNTDAYERESMTVRQFLQLFGTEGCRDGVHDNFWVNALMSEYIGEWDSKVSKSSIPRFPNWIVTDCRFMNEADAFKAQSGFIFRINRDMVHDDDTHTSECALDNYIPDAIILNHSGIDSIVSQTKDILKHFNIV